MHMSPSLKAALWSSRRERVEYLQPPHRAAAPRPESEAAGRATGSTQPDYGCVEWFFYDERNPRNGL